MPVTSNAPLLVLHSLRLKGFATAQAIAGQTGVAAVDVDALLAEFAAAGLASYRDGRISGWSLTPDGRDRHAGLVASELAETGARDAIGAAYRRFRQINMVVLGVCTDWQMRTLAGRHVVNDHTDAVYDAAVIERLEKVHTAAEPISADLATTLGRFAGYGPRLAHALERVRAGDGDWFTKPTIDSYHTVWFELHEDLLATLGIERAKEDA